MLYQTLPQTKWQQNIFCRLPKKYPVKIDIYLFSIYWKVKSFSFLSLDVSKLISVSILIGNPPIETIKNSNIAWSRKKLSWKYLFNKKIRKCMDKLFDCPDSWRCLYYMTTHAWHALLFKYILNVGKYTIPFFLCKKIGQCIPWKCNENCKCHLRM